jgi:hypothetical protein
MLRKLTIPTLWSDITLKDFQRFMGANPTDDNADDLALAIFCGIDEDEQHLFPKGELDEIKDILTGIFLVNPPLQRFITIGDTKYGFHPKLEDMSLGEFVDIEQYMSDPIKNAQKWLGVLYRPVIKEQFGRHDIEPYHPDKHDGAAFEGVTMDIVQGALLFFYRLEIGLQASSLTSLNQQAKHQKPSTQEQDSPSVGDGMQSSISLLGELYKILKR